MLRDPEKTKNEIIAWIQKYFEENGPSCTAVIGISGGKDSSVAAALCAQALGKDRVLGVLMPNGVQPDINYSQDLVEFLEIPHATINIHDATEGVLSQMQLVGLEPSRTTKVNLPSRIRMATLYAISQSCNGRVANTCNLSEDFVGYSTRYGDSVGDFSPLSRLTVAEVKEIGYELGLPRELVDKTPIDGLCGKTDEDNLGFTYMELDQYIRSGCIADAGKKERIDLLHRMNRFKLQLMPSFESGLSTIDDKEAQK